MTTSHTQEPSYVYGDRNDEAKQVIHKHLTTQSLSVEQSASDLLQTIRAPTTQSSQSVKDDNRAWLLCQEIFYAAFEPPTESGIDHDTALHRLASLLGAMLSNPESQEVLSNSSTKDMTLAWDFSIAAAEMWNSAPRRLTPPQWRNLQAFLAIAWAQGAYKQPLDGIWLLRQLLENEFQFQNGELSRDLPAALAFVTYAGKVMFQSSQTWEHHRPGDNTSGNPAALGPLLKEQAQSNNIEIPNGYSKARWTFWKNRFEQIEQEAAQRSDAEDISRDAKMAVKVMTEIEEHNS